jgi:hypothetical protein
MAIRAYTNLLANGATGTRDWQAALARLSAEARVDQLRAFNVPGHFKHGPDRIGRSRERRSRRTNQRFASDDDLQAGLHC